MQLPPLPEQPPVIDGMWAAYFGIVATILIGIFFTRDDKRNFENILSNLVSFALLLATIQFTWLLLLFMGFYLFAGMLVAVDKKTKWFFLFGSKTYGPLSLILLLVYDNRLPVGFQLHEIDFPLTTIVLEKVGYIILFWFILSLSCHIVGYLYWRKPSPKKSSDKAAKKGKAKASLKATLSSGKRKKRS
jgi:hypothetical protein